MLLIFSLILLNIVRQATCAPHPKPEQSGQYQGPAGATTSAIQPTESTPASTTMSPQAASMPTALAIGIFVGCAVLAVLAILGLVRMRRQLERKRRNLNELAAAATTDVQPPTELWTPNRKISAMSDDTASMSWSESSPRMTNKVMMTIETEEYEAPLPPPPAIPSAPYPNPSRRNTNPKLPPLPRFSALPTHAQARPPSQVPPVPQLPTSTPRTVAYPKPIARLTKVSLEGSPHISAPIGLPLHPRPKSQHSAGARSIEDLKTIARNQAKRKTAVGTQLVDPGIQRYLADSSLPYLPNASPSTKTRNI